MKSSAEVLWEGLHPGEKSRLAEELAGTFIRSVSPVMLELARIVEDVAPTDIPVLITGECGSGKEVLVRDLFLHSRRTHEPLVKVACSRLMQVQGNGDPFDVEIESGGKSGTLLLDGIGELALPLQGNLVQMLDRNTNGALGGNGSGAPLWRVIATSTKDLEPEVKGGRFRSDLFYRLSAVSLHLPPLRERKEDVRPLAEFFISKFSEAFGRTGVAALSKSDLSGLMNYAWPGNIRELENVIRNLVVLNGREDALLNLSYAPLAATRSVPKAASEAAEHLSLKEATRLAARDVEREFILRALTQRRWNRKQAAQDLGISYKALHYKLRELGLDGKPSEKSIGGSGNRRES